MGYESLEDAILDNPRSRKSVALTYEQDREWKAYNDRVREAMEEGRDVRSVNLPIDPLVREKARKSLEQYFKKSNPSDKPLTSYGAGETVYTWKPPADKSVTYSIVKVSRVGDEWVKYNLMVTIGGKSAKVEFMSVPLWGQVNEQEEHNNLVKRLEHSAKNSWKPPFAASTKKHLKRLIKAGGGRPHPALMTGDPCHGDNRMHQNPEIVRPKLRIVTIKGSPAEKAERKVWNAFVVASWHGQCSVNIHAIKVELAKTGTRMDDKTIHNVLERMRKQKRLQYYSPEYMKEANKTWEDLESGGCNASGSVQVWYDVFATPAHSEHHLMSHPSGETAFPSWENHPLNKKRAKPADVASAWRKKMYGNPCHGEERMYQNPVEGYLYDYASPQDRALTESYVAKRIAMYGGEPTFVEIDYIRRGVPEQVVLNAIIDGQLDPDHIAAGPFGLLPPPEVVATAAAAGAGRDWSAYRVFKKAAEKLGISARIRNKKFTWNNEVYTVKELYPRARKEQVGAKLKYDRSGIVWTFPLRTVKSQLTRAGVDWRP